MGNVKIISFAVKHYRRTEKAGVTDYTVEKALLHSMDYHGVECAPSVKEYRDWLEMAEAWVRSLQEAS